MKTTALIVAAGSSSRLSGEVPKQYREVAGRPLLSWTITRFEQAESIDEVVLVVAEEYLLFTSERVVDPFAFHKCKRILIGGESRQESVYKGLTSLPDSTELVAIHDGARPLVATSDVDRVVQTAKTQKAALLAAPIADTIKRVQGNFVMSTVDRSGLFAAQTPQVFDYKLILQAHQKAAADSSTTYTDDASIAEAAGHKVVIVEPEFPNPKITTPADFEMLKLRLSKEQHA